MELSVEAQLAVLNTKLDTLISYSQQLGQDHEARIRTIEADYTSSHDMERSFRRTIAVLTVVSVVLSAAVNAVAFIVR